MIEELESEITEMRFIAQRAGGGDIQKLEGENIKLRAELSTLKNNLDEMSNELGKFSFYQVLCNLLFFMLFLSTFSNKEKRKYSSNKRARNQVAKNGK